MYRPALVIVPSFSVHEAAGKTTSAYCSVSTLLLISCTTTNFAFFNPASAMRASGRLVKGLVHNIHIAFSLPSFNASNILVAVSPGLELMVPNGICQNFSTSLRCCSLARSRWAGSKLHKPPTSLPPIALG